MTSATLRYLLGLFETDPEHISIDAAHRSQINAGLAAEAVDLFNQAYDEGDAEVVERAAEVAIFAYVLLGYRRESYDIWLNKALFLYEQARDVAEFSAARDESLKLMDFAAAERLAKLRFSASLLAAQCAGRAAEVNRHGWLLVALEDITRTSELASTAPLHGWFDTFLNWSTHLSYLAMVNVWSGTESARSVELLRRLAANLEAVVPDGHIPSPPLNAIGMVNSLAELSVHHGDPSAARRRLDAVAAALKSRQDTAALAEVNRAHRALLGD